MTTTKSKTVAKSTEPKPAAPETCNVAGCRHEPTTRGLCDPHWATCRGLANPKTEDKPR